MFAVYASATWRRVFQTIYILWESGTVRTCLEMNSLISCKFGNVFHRTNVVKEDSWGRKLVGKVDIDPTLELWFTHWITDRTFFWLILRKLRSKPRAAHVFFIFQIKKELFILWHTLVNSPLLWKNHGWLCGYLRPDQFLDHLTVIKKGHQSLSQDLISKILVAGHKS